MLEGILTGLSAAFTFQAIALVVLGCIIGSFIGMVPGLGPMQVIAIMIPVAVGIGEPSIAMIMLAGVYYGAVFGGSTSSILINAPGVASTVATSFDGYPMAVKGEAGRALGADDLDEEGPRIAGVVVCCEAGLQVRDRAPLQLQRRDSEVLLLDRAVVDGRLHACDRHRHARQVEQHVGVVRHDLADDARVAPGDGFGVVDVVEHVHRHESAEVAAADQLIDAPVHPYTKALISAVPSGVPGSRTERARVPTTAPIESGGERGCAFAPRCPDAQSICREATPMMEHKDGGHEAAWHDSAQRGPRPRPISQ